MLRSIARQLALTSLLALSFGAAACGDTIVDGPKDFGQVQIESAVISRCNQMMEFSGISFTFTVTNTGDVPLVLGGVAFEGADAAATYVDGTTTLSAPVLLLGGRSARFSCAPDVALTWQTSAAPASLVVDVGISLPDGSGGGTVSDEASLQFIEAWDNCDTFASEPHPCTPI